MITIGIDPGKNGAVAALQDDGILHVDATPVVDTTSGKKAYNEEMMCELLLIIKGRAKREKQKVLAGIEQQQAYPNQGGVSNFSTGDGFGLWRGLLRGVGIQFHRLSVRDWRHAIFTPDEIEDFDIWKRSKARKLTPLMKRENKENRKRCMIRKASDLHPSARKYIQKHDGMAEAILIADATRRIYGV